METAIMFVPGENFRIRGFKDAIAGEFAIDWPKEGLEKAKGTIHNGENFSLYKKDFEGFTSRPADWKIVEEKFRNLLRVIQQKKHLTGLLK